MPYIWPAPSSFELHSVTFDRRDVVGQGGEATVYRGQMDDQSIVVREVVRPLKAWRSSAGRKIIQVISNELDHPYTLTSISIASTSRGHHSFRSSSSKHSTFPWDLLRGRSVPSIDDFAAH